MNKKRIYLSIIATFVVFVGLNILLLYSRQETISLENEFLFRVFALYAAIVFGTAIIIPIYLPENKTSNKFLNYLSSIIQKNSTEIAVVEGFIGTIGFEYLLKNNFKMGIIFVGLSLLIYLAMISISLLAILKANKETNSPTA